MSAIREIIRDYGILKKRIEIEYDARMNKGGLEHDIHDEWEMQGVGHICSKPDNLRTSSFILAVLRHPIKTPLCLIGYYLERKESSLGMSEYEC